MIKFIAAFSCVFALTGCASSMKVTAPDTNRRIENTIKVAGNKDEVWSRLVPRLSKQFFVINNIDKESGLINVSYSGDPSQYVDCGYAVSSLLGKDTKINGSAANAQYDFSNGLHFFEVTRLLNLEGRLNIILENVDSDATQVTANTRYVLQRNMNVVPVSGGLPSQFSDSIAFNTGETGVFQNRGGEQTTCVSTGVLEEKILFLAK